MRTAGAFTGVTFFFFFFYKGVRETFRGVWGLQFVACGIMEGNGPTHTLKTILEDCSTLT